MSLETGPLKGIRVFELAHIMEGQVYGLMLSDMGADVIKVEKPNDDDSRRSVAPRIAGESAAYTMTNLNKRGISLNLKSENTQKILLKLLSNRCCF